MTGNTYGYVRVSTHEQNEDRQLIAMRELPIPDKNLFVEKQSGNLDFCMALSAPARWRSPPRSRRPTPPSRP